ncbi:unnamed protein product [Linum trigynum]|uniref:Expp1 protein n=1 Tax=Linum trigynum TaxID=586398 RepID=A0AAV2DEE8_9ROSI
MATAIFQPIRILILALALSSSLWIVTSEDTNRVFSPCADTKVQLSDGYTFGIVFASRNAFYNNGNTSGTQLSPCDSRLGLSGQNAQLSVFRPKVDEISILTVNTSSFSPDNVGGYMVAFGGRKYAARSLPAFVANGTYTVTSFTLVLEFQKGRLQNLFWKRDGCAKCGGPSGQGMVCLNNQDCAIRTSSCKNHGGNVDCSIGIQLAFSGTDKHYSALNSWYEVENLRQYSLFKLYSNLRDSLTSQYDSIFN